MRRAMACCLPAAALTVAALLAACSDGGPTDSGSDAGSPRDAGGPHPDGGPQLADGGGADAGPQTTFTVTVPAGTPRYDAVCVAGSTLQDWDPCGLALARGSDGLYRGGVALPAGTTLQYKLTRATWDSVEKDAGGGEIDNRTVLAGAHADVTVAKWADGPTVTGDVENLGTFTSTLTSLAPRPVLVYLPPSYETDTAARYPVLYMHDGQNLFDVRTSFAGVEWGVDETAERLITAGQMAPVIIVAVGNTADRMDEYTESYDSDEQAGGKADLYAQLLVQELKPVIDQRYRTVTDADHTGVAGSSLGGLVSMYFGLTQSATFRRIGVVSPSVFWDNRDIVSRVQSLSQKLPLRIWEDIGTAEGSDGETVSDAEALRDALVAKGWVLGDDLHYLEVPGAQHNETYWAARVDQILEYLYPPGR